MDRNRFATLAENDGQNGARSSTRENRPITSHAQSTTLMKTPLKAKIAAGTTRAFETQLIVAQVLHHRGVRNVANVIRWKQPSGELGRREDGRFATNAEFDGNIAEAVLSLPRHHHVRHVHRQWLHQ